MDIEAANKLRNEQLAEQAAATAKIQAVAMARIEAGPKLPTMSIANLTGKWHVASVYSGPSIISSAEIVISKDTILLATNCNTFSITYSLVSESPIKIKRESFRQTQNKCNTSNDEALYKNALIKVTALKVLQDAGKMIVKLVDDQGVETYEIQRPVELKILNLSSSTP